MVALYKAHERTCCYCQGEGQCLRASELLTHLAQAVSTRSIIQVVGATNTMVWSLLWDLGIWYAARKPQRIHGIASGPPPPCTQFQETHQGR